MSDFWKTIWDSKGSSKSEDLLFLDGYEHLGIEFNSASLHDGIVNCLGCNSGDSILEVGCGAGFLSREFSSEYDYVGCDYSQSLVDKHRRMFPKHVIHCAEASKLPFSDNEFDYSFCFGVYQYLPSLEYADRMIGEMKRVSKKGILLGDLKEDATRDQHLPCPKQRMKELGFCFSEPFYEGANDCYRYNAYLIMESDNDLE